MRLCSCGALSFSCSGPAYLPEIKQGGQPNVNPPIDRPARVPRQFAEALSMSLESDWYDDNAW